MNARRCTSWSAVVIATVGLIAGCSARESERTGTVEQDLSSCISVPAAADALLSNPPMDHNFGGQPFLRAGGKDESLLAFDLSVIPPAAAITSATLGLYVTANDGTTAVNVHRATAAWSEATVTFASFAQHYDPAITTTIDTPSANVQKSVDLTALVTSWVTGAQPNDGVMLESSSKQKMIFVSREGGTPEQKPHLQVCFTTPDDHCASGPVRTAARARTPARRTCVIARRGTPERAARH